MLHRSILRIPDQTNESECRTDKHNLAVDDLVASHRIRRCLEDARAHSQQPESSSREQVEMTYMGSTEAGPVIGLHAVLEVAFGLVDEKAGLGTAGAAEHGIWDDAT